MKVIALVPFRNEEWILPAYLSSVAPVVDEIVGIDDASTDGSRRLVEAAGGHVFGARPGGDWQKHWGWIREDMLRIGRERGGTHFVCLDADEALTSPVREHLFPALEALEPGGKLVMQWLALWKDPFAYRADDSVWSDNFKDFAFADADGLTFVGQWPHRIGRTPGPNDERLMQRLELENGGVLHFQFVAWLRFQVKQAWYRCAELIRAPDRPYDINAMYAPTLDDAQARTQFLPDAWIDGITIPTGLASLPPTWHWDEMLEWFDVHGIEFFEPLQIWHVPELHARFVRELGREPRALTRLSPTQRVRRAIESRIAARRGADSG